MGIESTPALDKLARQVKTVLKVCGILAIIAIVIAIVMWSILL